MSDLGYIVFWWLIIISFGVVNLPLTSFLFSNFVDLGFGFSKTLAILISTYLIFLLSMAKIFPLSRIYFLFALVLLATFNFFLIKIKKDIRQKIRKKFWIIFFQEIFFTLGFVAWSIVRGYQPDILGLEKFMDFGFVNSILQSKYLPPKDMWFAKENINYYWYGYFVSAFLIKLSGIPSAIGYNLMLATILGLTLVGSFSISSSLVKNLQKKINLKKILLSGLISAVLLTFGGNFHTPIYVLKKGIKSYWYPDATRFIGYNPNTDDKTIHEFPIYSFVVSDLHPHLLDLPFVLLFIALLFLSIIKKETKKPIPKNEIKLVKKISIAEIKSFLKKRGLSYLSPIFNRQTFLLGFTLGILFMTNTWDFANYLLVCAFSLFIHTLTQGIKKETLTKGIFKFLTILFLGVVFALPFILNFKSIAQGIGFVHSRTPLWQLAILWGFPAINSLIFSLFLLKKGAKTVDVFVLSLLFSSWILILIPEIVYVKDIYSPSYYRANTMFKLTYQAFIMFYLLTGYIFVRILARNVSFLEKLLTLSFFGLMFALVLWYPNFAINSYYGSFKNYKGLSGEKWVKEQHPDIYRAIIWLRQNADSQSVILEANGDSYSEFNVISSYTGLPTVLGWFVHEWLWRNSPSISQERASDIETIYTSKDSKLVKSLIEKYGIDYIIVCEFEKRKFKNLNLEVISNLGEKVFKEKTCEIYKV